MENKTLCQARDLPLFAGEETPANDAVKEERLTDETGGETTAPPDAGEASDADAFEELIRGRYKKEFDQRVQKILDGRFRKAREEQETLKKMRQEDEQRRAGEASRARETLRRLEQSAPDIAAVYPGFDWREELKNETFGRLVAAGADPRSAYEVAHREEILHRAMRYSADRTREEVARSLTARSRVPENGSAAQAAAVLRTDPALLTPEERQDIRRRVQNGEKIRF